MSKLRLREAKVTCPRSWCCQRWKGSQPDPKYSTQSIIPSSPHAQAVCSCGGLFPLWASEVPCAKWNKCGPPHWRDLCTNRTIRGKTRRRQGSTELLCPLRPSTENSAHQNRGRSLHIFITILHLTFLFNLTRAFKDCSLVPWNVPLGEFLLPCTWPLNFWGPHYQPNNGFTPSFSAREARKEKQRGQEAWVSPTCPVTRVKSLLCQVLQIQSFKCLPCARPCAGAEKYKATNKGI